MRLFILFAAFACCFSDLQAQVNRTVVVEHFTNTVCSVCASRNPGFYNNLDQHPEILHIAYHPSSPYSSCVLNQHNVSENDDRTNYYGVYGGTPRLVIEGTVISAGANYNEAALFEPYLNQMSPASLTIEQFKENGMLQAKVTVTNEGGYDGSELLLTIPVVEEVLNYAAPNGEDVHYDVFRKEGTITNSGITLTLPSEGLSVNYFINIPTDAAWDFDQIYTMAILQNATTKEVLQAAAVSPDLSEPITTSAHEIAHLEGVQITPNPADELIQIQLTNALPSNAKLYDLTGKLVEEQVFVTQTTFDVKGLLSGVYVLKIQNKNGIAVEQIFVK